MALIFVTGLAAGNFWATREALEGSQHWWGKQVKLQQQRDYDTCAKVLEEAKN